MAIGGCGGGSAARGSLGARGGALAPVMATVPADAGVVLHLPVGVFALMPRSMEAELRQGWSEAVADPSIESDLDAVVHAMLEDALARPGSMGGAIGWQPGTGEVVAWSRGAMGLVRVRLDGSVLRASLERAERKSGRKLATAVWRGQAYYPLHRPDGAEPHVLARVTDREALVLLTREPERDLPLLMDDAPQARPFDPSPVVEAMFPGRGAEAHFAMMVDPGWLGDLAAALDETGESKTPCARAGLALLGRLPAVHTAWARSADVTEIASAIALDRGSARQIAAGLSPIPRWSDTPPGLVMGVGLAPSTALEVIGPWLRQADELAAVCGQSLGLANKLQVASSLAPLAAIRAVSVTMDPARNNGVLAVRPDDVARFWAQLRGLVSILRAQPPAIGERLRLPGAVVTSDGASLLMAMGDPLDETWLDRAPAGDGPAALAAFVLGEDALAQLAREDPDDGSEQFLRWVRAAAVDLRLQGEQLVVRWVFQHR